jgi:hypothetical protein
VSGAGVEANGISYDASLSFDGRFVGFTSIATNLVAPDTNKNWDAFVRDRASATVQLVGRSTHDEQGNDSNANARLSGDGLVVAFWSRATNLVDDDMNGFSDWFVREACATVASWSNYGSGYPGTLGVPSLVAPYDPVIGSTAEVDVGNSAGVFTVALLFVGFQQIQLHSSLGGDLLVLPQWTSVVALGSGGSSFSANLPFDGSLCGMSIDLQAWEADAGAAKGVSFTPGLELVLGH